MESAVERPLLIADPPVEPPKNDVESNTVCPRHFSQFEVDSRPRVVVHNKKRKRKSGCCRCCGKILCGAIALLFVVIAIAMIVPLIKEAFSPAKTDVGWSKPHNEWQKRKMNSLAERINRENRGWKARYNPFAHADNAFYFPSPLERGQEQLTEVLGLAVHTVKEAVAAEDRMVDTIEHIQELRNATLSLPSSFDARERWSRCSSIHQITNQGACGSCWAMAASSVMSDRLCISTNYSRQETISAQDLMSCCPTCGSCGGGGFLISAFKLWKERGLVTGGAYGSNEGCKPYQISNQCGYPCSIEYYTKDRTPKCENKCQPLYRKSYEEDLIKSRKAYWLRSKPFDDDSMDWRVKEQIKINEAIEKVMPSPRWDQTPIQDLLKRELFLHGPVMGCLIIGEQFLLYESGIYSWEQGDYMYSHCMRLIGWGEEGGVGYWTYANSWGRNWGENGFIRINMKDSVPSDIAAGLF